MPTKTMKPRLVNSIPSEELASVIFQLKNIDWDFTVKFVTQCVSHHNITRNGNASIAIKSEGNQIHIYRNGSIQQLVIGEGTLEVAPVTEKDLTHVLREHIQ